MVLPRRDVNQVSAIERERWDLVADPLMGRRSGVSDYLSNLLEDDLGVLEG